MHQKTLFLGLFLAMTPVVLLAEPPQSAAKPVKYTVKSGDCLWNISGAVLGDPLKWPMIYTANEGKIRDPNLIYPGQKFAMPPPSAITKAALRRATRVAYAHMGQARERIAREKSPPAEVAQAPPEKAMTSDKEAANLPPVAEEKPVVPAVPTSNGPYGLIIGVVLIVLIGGFFIWRKMASIPEENQAPRPLSSFPEVRNVTPMPDRPQEKKEERAEPPMQSGYITSVSMPSEPAATQTGNPVPPAAQGPSGTPATGTAPAPPPAPPAGQQPPVDKPGDSTPPPSSTHAA